MINFEKLHGIGNDFIIIDDRDNQISTYNEIARKMCDRRFGIGADGFMVVKQSQIADIQMLFFNADGSQAPMCGNGIRCFSKYVYDHQIVKDKNFIVETLGGMMRPEIFTDDLGETASVKVNLGQPKLIAQDIPVATEKDLFFDETIEIEGKIFKISALQIGSVHAVIFIDNVEDFDIDYYGPRIETHSLFPKKINVNFCQVIDKNELKVITWERGVGQTLACGTGAACAAYMHNALYDGEQLAKVNLLGGAVIIELVEDTVYMTGPAEFICKGEYRWMG